MFIAWRRRASGGGGGAGVQPPIIFQIAIFWQKKQQQKPPHPNNIRAKPLDFRASNGENIPSPPPPPPKKKKKKNGPVNLCIAWGKQSCQLKAGFDCNHLLLHNSKRTEDRMFCPFILNVS